VAYSDRLREAKYLVSNSHDANRGGKRGAHISQLCALLQERSMSRQRFRWLPLDRRAGGGGLPCSGDLGRPCRHRPPGRSSTAEQRSRADGRRRRRRSLPQRRRLPSVVERGRCSAATGEAEGPRRSRIWRRGFRGRATTLTEGPRRSRIWHRRARTMQRDHGRSGRADN
jgi:hypothetical protein